MKVKAAPGLKCPMEGSARKYITDAGITDVPNTAYYERLVADGSLIRIDAAKSREKGVITDGQ